MSRIFQTLAMSFLFITASYGQIVSMTTANKDSVSFGDPVTLSYTLSQIPTDCNQILIDLNSLSNKMYAEDSALFEQYADLTLEISDGSVTDYYDASDNTISIPISALAGMDGQSFTLVVKFFSFGVFNISPAQLLTANDSILPAIAQSGSIIVTVPSHLQQDTTLTIADIKPIQEVKRPIMRTILQILVAILLMVLAWYLWKKYKKRKEALAVEPIAEPEVIPAHIKALEALYQLRMSRKWESGETKGFQTELTDIIRSYLENRYNIPALELTSDEIIDLITRKRLMSGTWSGILDDILHIADLVKFAKAEPDQNIHLDFLDKSVDFVESTKEKQAHG